VQVAVEDGRVSGKGGLGGFPGVPGSAGEDGFRGELMGFPAP